MNESTEPSPDQRLLQRYVDGELDPADRIRFEERLASEPSLREALSDLETTRSLLGKAAAAPVVIPADFRARIVSQVSGRRPDLGSDVLPDGSGVEVARSGAVRVVDHRVATWGVRVVCAAALLLAACAAFAFGWFDRAESGDLSANPNQLRTEMEALDQEIEADRAAVEQGAVEQGVVEQGGTGGSERR